MFETRMTHDFENDFFVSMGYVYILSDNFKFAVDERVLHVGSSAFYMGWVTCNAFANYKLKVVGQYVVELSVYRAFPMIIISGYVNIFQNIS